MNIVLAFPTLILSWIATLTIAAVSIFMGGGDDDDEDLTYNGPPTPP